MKFDLSTLKLSTDVKHQVAVMAKGYGVLNSNISASVTYPEPLKGYTLNISINTNREGTLTLEKSDGTTTTVSTPYRYPYSYKTSTFTETDIAKIKSWEGEQTIRQTVNGTHSHSPLPKIVHYTYRAAA